MFYAHFFLPTTPRAFNILRGVQQRSRVSDVPGLPARLAGPLDKETGNSEKQGKRSRLPFTPPPVRTAPTPRLPMYVTKTEQARPNTAKYIINNVRPQPAVSGRRENASLGGSADEKLGMTARTRIYSFTGEMGSGHQNGMLRAMHAAAGDAHRRRRPSTAGAARRPDFDGRGVDDEKKTAAWVSERSDPDTSGRPLSARETAGTDNMDTQKHLGVVDISKVRQTNMRWVPSTPSKRITIPSGPQLSRTIKIPLTTLS